MASMPSAASDLPLDVVELAQQSAAVVGRSRSMLSRMFCCSMPLPPGTNGAKAEPTGPVASILPKSMRVGSHRVDGLRKKGRVGRHAVDRVGEARHARIDRAQVGAERLLAVNDRVDDVVADIPARTYDRTTANRFARLASCGNDEPNVMPGNDVATSPVTVRILSGTFILGSNVSSCDGPPNMYRQMTDLPVVIGFLPAASAEAPSRCGSDRPPRPSEPMRRNSRREKPGRPSNRDSMIASL